MDKGRILLKLVLDQIELGGLELEYFAGRLTLQKKVYLLQLTGLDLRYRYNWYLRGPYCPSLTENAFLLKDEIESGENDYDEYVLSKPAKDNIEKASTIWGLEGEGNRESGLWLELLASLHYLRHIAYWPQKNVTKDTIFEKLVVAKPLFKDKAQLMEKAWERLDKCGLLANKTLA